MGRLLGNRSLLLQEVRERLLQPEVVEELVGGDRVAVGGMKRSKTMTNRGGEDDIDREQWLSKRFESTNEARTC